MLKKDEIITKIKSLGWDNDKFVIISGAALVLEDMLDETNDIDIAVSPDLFESLDWECKSVYDGIVAKSKDDFDISSNNFEEYKKRSFRMPESGVECYIQNALDAIYMKEKNFIHLESKILETIAELGTETKVLDKNVRDNVVRGLIVTRNRKAEALCTAKYRYAERTINTISFIINLLDHAEEQK